MKDDEITFPDPHPEFVPTKNAEGALIHEQMLELLPYARVGFDCMNGRFYSSVPVRTFLTGDEVLRVSLDEESARKVEAAIKRHHGIIPFSEATYEQKVKSLCTPDHPEYQRISCSKS